MIRRVMLFLGLLAMAPLALASNAVSVRQVQKPVGEVTRSLVSALQKDGFKVVKKINIGKKIGEAAKRGHWKDYNENHLAGVRTVIFCNAKFANAIANADPDMVALCPLHMTLVQQGDATKIEFVRPSVVAEGSKAEPVARKLEAKIEAAEQKAIR